jgi:hypothetical protein
MLFVYDHSIFPVTLFFQTQQSPPYLVLPQITILSKSKYPQISQNLKFSDITIIENSSTGSRN